MNLGGGIEVHAHLRLGIEFTASKLFNLAPSRFFGVAAPGSSHQARQGDALFEGLADGRLERRFPKGLSLQKRTK